MKNAAHSAAMRASQQSWSILPDSKPPVGGRCPAAVIKGIGWNRQGTLERSRAIDGGACTSGDVGGAGSESSSSAASATNSTAFRRLANFKTLCSLVWTTYSLPILTIE